MRAYFLTPDCIHQLGRHVITLLGHSGTFVPSTPQPQLTGLDNDRRRRTINITDLSRADDHRPW